MYVIGVLAKTNQWIAAFYILKDRHIEKTQRKASRAKRSDYVSVVCRMYCLGHTSRYRAIPCKRSRKFLCDGFHVIICRIDARVRRAQSRRSQSESVTEH